MRSRLSKLSRLLLIPALLVAVSACKTTDYQLPADQKATPVQPEIIFIELTSDRTTLQAGQTETVAVLRFVGYDQDWNPLPDQTKVELNSNLGNFQSQGGAQKLTLDMYDGELFTIFYAGSVSGIARISATVEGVSDLVEIVIFE
jgi:hypothetical protein